VIQTYFIKYLNEDEHFKVILYVLRTKTFNDAMYVKFDLLLIILEQFLNYEVFIDDTSTN